jgi:hypothetical protein
MELGASAAQCSIRAPEPCEAQVPCLAQHAGAQRCTPGAVATAQGTRSLQGQHGRIHFRTAITATRALP